MFLELFGLILFVYFLEGKKFKIGNRHNVLEREKIKRSFVTLSECKIKRYDDWSYGFLLGFVFVGALDSDFWADFF